MVDPSGQTILPPFNTTAPAYLESEGQTRELSLANRPVGYLVDINLCLWASVGRALEHENQSSRTHDHSD